MTPLLAMGAVALAATFVRSAPRRGRRRLGLAHSRFTPRPRRRAPAAGRAGVHQRWRTRRGSPDAALAEFCEAVARRLRSGLSLPAALAEPVHGDMAHLVAPVLVRHQRGTSLYASLTHALDDATDPGWMLVLGTLRVQDRFGAAGSEPLDRLAMLLRERAAITHERRAQSATAELSATVMTVVPLAFAGLAVATDPGVRHVLVATPTGWACAAGGLALNAAGRVWSSRIMRDVT